MLSVCATPIGNWSDLTLRAVEALKSADLIIGEEKREVELLLKRAGAFPKPYELLNEHSTKAEMQSLASLCKDKNVVLVSDCGTPGFCDPGADLVAECRKHGIDVRALPGPSSLMTLLSVAGQRIDEFWFVGFLPREADQRATKLKKVCASKTATIIMDTPYRLKKTLEEIAAEAPKALITLGCDLTQENERVFIGTATKVLESLDREKGEFVLILQNKN